MLFLVESMLALHIKLADANIEHDREVIQRKIDMTDRQIDNLLYELYGLSEEEIRIIEAP